MSKVITTVVAPDISCMHCIKAVTEGLTPLSGIDNVAVDLSTKTVKVEYDDAVIGENDIKEKMADLGYPVQE